MISMAASPSLLLFGLLLAFPTNVISVGVCYGMRGNNLPAPAEVVQLYKSKNIAAMRLYDPNTAALEALRSSGIHLTVGVPNDSLQSIAADGGAATTWVKKNIVPFSSTVDFRYIAVGNEVIPGNLATFVLPAMKNIQSALKAAGVNNVKVSTAVSESVLAESSPPSAGYFSPEANTYMSPITEFLAANGAPLLLNVYPYFAHAGDPSKVRLDYALFTAPGTVVVDGSLSYQNLFDAMVDAVYSALEKVGAAGVKVVVSETGWPTAGGTAATVENGRTYNTNLIKHVGQGTPKRPGGMEVYIFAMFNENQKSPGVEQNFGLFYPDKTPVYPIDF